jgi:hypothetical protein
MTDFDLLTLRYPWRVRLDIVMTALAVIVAKLALIVATFLSSVLLCGSLSLRCPSASCTAKRALVPRQPTFARLPEAPTMSNGTRRQFSYGLLWSEKDGPSQWPVRPWWR